MTMAAFVNRAILEPMGHRIHIDLEQEAEMFGVKMLRIDIPPQRLRSLNYHPQAVYALLPVAKDAARTEAARYGDPRPVRPLEYRQLPSPGNGLATDSGAALLWRG